MYFTLLLLHSWNRWAILLALLTALGLAYRGWQGALPYRPLDRRVSAVLTGLLHLQLLLGLMLYSGFSPWARHPFSPNPTVRFWSLTHPSLLLTAIVVAQLGQSLAKRATTDVARHRWSALGNSLALGLVLLGIPFASRPWFRLY